MAVYAIPAAIIAFYLVMHASYLAQCIARRQEVGIGISLSTSVIVAGCVAVIVGNLS